MCDWLKQSIIHGTAFFIALKLPLCERKNERKSLKAFFGEILHGLLAHRHTGKMKKEEKSDFFMFATKKIFNYRFLAF